MEKIAKILGKNEAELEKILLFEKKKFLKDITYSAYNKNKSIANVNTLSKAIYNAIF
jgi:myosin heavy subunit